MNLLMLAVAIVGQAVGLTHTSQTQVKCCLNSIAVSEVYCSDHLQQACV